MTDNTNIDELPELPATRKAWEYSDETFVYTENQMIEYGLLCRRAALSNAEPVAHMGNSTGSLGGSQLVWFRDPDKLPLGSNLFLHPSVPVPQWINVKEQFPECDARRDDTPVTGPQGPIAPANYSLTVLVLLDGGGIRTDHAVYLDGGMPFFENYNKRVKYWMNTPALPLTNTGEQG